MEEREDLKSILPFLPLIIRSSSLFWPPKALESLKALALGPDVSGVVSGEVLFDAILDLRESVGLSGEPLAWKAAEGYALFFDDLMSRIDSRTWFREVMPELANFLLRLPSILEAHYRDSDEKFGEGKGGLRLLHQQESGLVFLSQDLIASLLVCAFFCLFPASSRTENYLPTINFDYLFASLYPNTKQSNEEKVKCLIHYFKRIFLCMPKGFVSFKRKVLSFEKKSCDILYPEATFWRNSTISLCPFEVFSSGLIEDQKHDALEIDFANEYLGGGALHRGCVQEEIRFMINSELIAGMLFMASMRKNEAIEIVGVERFSCYSGYGSSFRFVGDYLDKKPLDFIGRRKTKIIAIDALANPGIRQFEIKYLLRETNKAYCGFTDCKKYKCFSKNMQEVDFSEALHGNGNEADGFICDNIIGCDRNSSQAYELATCTPLDWGTSLSSSDGFSGYESCYERTGIATGNWGCGAFGGDPEIKSIIQWLAASQALRPFLHYYSFGEGALQKLEKVSRWILVHEWTVGDLWNMLVEYSMQRLNGQAHVGFFTWLLPEQSADTADNW